MVQAIAEGMTLDKFLDRYPDGYGRYELITKGETVRLVIEVVSTNW